MASPWGSYTFKDFSVQKGEVTLHLLPQLIHTFGQLAWLSPSGQIRLLFPVLEGIGICYGLLPPYLSDIPTSEDSIWRQLESLSMEEQWGGGCFAMVPYLLCLPGPLGVTEKARIFHASLLQLGIPGTANNSLHQSGVSVILAFHVTHSQSSHTGSSGGGPYSSEFSIDPLRKEVTPSSNSGSSPNSNPLAVTSPSLDSGLSQDGWQGAGLSVNCT